MGAQRYRTIIKIEEIRTLYENGKNEEAKELADGLNGEKIKDSTDLLLLATVYRNCGEYAKAKDYLHRVYEKKASWRVLEELMDVCLAEKNPKEASEYLQQYGKLSGGDPRSYIYEYRIGRQLHRPDAELLPILQTLRAEEYSEKYAYELAKLYHKLGRKEECLAECKELILWFGEGTYVERAKALQAYYRGELSAEDIPMEAERRIREAEERREREMQEHLEKEAREKAAKEREAKEKEVEEKEVEQKEAPKRTGESNRRKGVDRTVAAGRDTEEALKELENDELLKNFDVKFTDNTEELPPDKKAETSAEEAGEPPVEEAAEAKEVAGENAEETKEEPMWAEDHSVLTDAEIREDNESGKMQESSAEECEQLSMFASEADKETEDLQPEADEETEDSLPEADEALSEPGKTLAARLSEAEITLEESLHGFARIERIRKQILRMLDVEISVRKDCRCLIITGEKKSGKTTLAKYLTGLLYSLGCLKMKKIAKISAENLNRLDFEKKADLLTGTCLIVENASAISVETVAGLLDFIASKKAPGAVFFEDESGAMNAFLRKNSEMNRLFNNRVHLPKYDGKDLLTFAEEYIGEHDYEVSRGARKLLMAEAERLTTAQGTQSRLQGMLELAAESVKNADQRMSSQLLSLAAAGDIGKAGTMEIIASDVKRS